MRGGLAIVDLGAQGVQRHATLAVPLAATHLGAAEAAGALDTDTLGASLAGGLDGLAHGATEGHAALELLGDGLGDEHGVELEFIYYLKKHSYDSAIYFDTFPTIEDAEEECAQNIAMIGMLDRALDAVGLDEVQRVIDANSGIEAAKLMRRLLCACTE